MNAALATAPATVWHGLGEVPAGFGPCVATLGVFDGLHRGHAALVERTLLVGADRMLPTVLVTFDPHPARVLGLSYDTAQLSTIAHRAELARGLGIDAVCVLPFTPGFARLSPAGFVEQVLVSGLCAQAVVVGENFTFGHRAAGTVETLDALGSRHGFTTHRVELLHQSDTRCSSSAVRACLRCGDIAGATRILGRPHQVNGTLEPVDAAVFELVAAPGTALPAPGRYRGRLGGTGPVALVMTGDDRLLVESASVWPGRGSVEFTDREDPR